MVSKKGGKASKERSAKNAKPAKADELAKLGQATPIEKAAKIGKGAKADRPSKKRKTEKAAKAGKKLGKTAKIEHDDTAQLRRALAEMRGLVDEVRRENRALADLVKAYAKQNKRYAKQHGGG